MSNERLSELGVKHSNITSAQRTGFDDLAKSGKTNTMREHNKIAVQSMVKAGMDSREAERLVRLSLQSLTKMGISSPARIPWN